MDSSIFPFTLVTHVDAANLTVLRVPVLPALHSHSRPGGDWFIDLDFAIEWDEDRDERVLPAVRSLWYAGLLPPHICFVHETKGNLYVTIEGVDHCDPQFLPGGSVAAYVKALNEQACTWSDPWPVWVVGLSGVYVQHARLLRLGGKIRDMARLADDNLTIPSHGRFLP